MYFFRSALNVKSCEGCTLSPMYTFISTNCTFKHVHRNRKKTIVGSTSNKHQQSLISTKTVKQNQRQKKKIGNDNIRDVEIEKMTRKPVQILNPLPVRCAFNRGDYCRHQLDTKRYGEPRG